MVYIPRTFPAFCQWHQAETWPITVTGSFWFFTRFPKEPFISELTKTDFILARLILTFYFFKLYHLNGANTMFFFRLQLFILFLQNNRYALPEQPETKGQHSLYPWPFPALCATDAGRNLWFQFQVKPSSPR